MKNENQNEKLVKFSEKAIFQCTSGRSNNESGRLSMQSCIYMEVF